MPQPLPKPALILALACLLAAPSVSAGLPTQLSQMPVYPGAKPTRLEEGEWEQPSLQDGRKPQAKAFVVDAAPEEVLRWYAQRLGTPLDAHRDFEDDQAPGTVSHVNSAVYPHSLGDDDDGAGHILMSSAQKRALLAKCRPAFKKGEWANDGHFEWVRRNEDGSRSFFTVGITDVGVADGWKACVRRTRIVLVTETGKTEQEVEAERDAEHEKAFAAAQKEVGTKAPTEKELGVPLYPGARYDARSSAGMSMGDQRGYLFVTDDAPAQVVKFYEAKLGKRAQGDAQSGYMIALEGKGLVPDEGLAVQPNMLPGGGKTLITVMRQKPQRAE
jgi:hypothetical protein